VKILKLIIGLGNPGKEYDNTRHNIGFMVIDNYLKDKEVIWQSKFNALYTTLNINNEKVFFIKPQTYMNLSGNSVCEFVNFFKIESKDILVIHDDLDLPLGKYRIKINSSAGGHNGIKSIIERLGTNSFARLKVGISKTNAYDIKDYVLGRFTQEELKLIESLYPIFYKVINSFIINDISKVMNDFNRMKD
jgi:PTH1 family peptidyl-tRNA hydrolase